MTILAGRMGERYGMLPTDVLRQPPDEFWLNADIMQSTDAWRQEQRENHDRAQTDAGSATPQQKEELVEANEARADRREELADRGGAPDLDDQLADLGVRDDDLGAV